MTTPRWRRVEKLYHAALKRNPTERDRFLEQASEGDDSLRQEVKSLLAFDEKAESFLETTALGEAVRAVTGDESSVDGHKRVLTMLFEAELADTDLVPKLRVTTPSGHTRSVLLEGSHLSVGRSEQNDLSFPEDNGLSREHLILERHGSEWIVRDSGSKNGTYVNGAQITGRHLLHPGDRISASCITITYDGPRAHDPPNSSA